MNIKLLKSTIIGAKLFDENTITIDLTTAKKVQQEEIEEHVVQHLFSSIYKQNLISFAGINASGKTTTLKYLAVILNLFVRNSTIESNEEHYPEVFESLEDKCTLINYFYSEKEKRIYELTSKIERTNNQFFFTEEILKYKTAHNNLSKRQTMDFSNIEPGLVRSELTDFAKELLRDDSSIFVVVWKENGMSPKKRYFYDLMDFTNVNMIVGDLTSIPRELIQYFDPNIESIIFPHSNSSKTLDAPIRIKFRGATEMEVTRLDLWKYLSSGTIKGLNLLMTLESVLKNGGYAIIDEIENHLNKTIVITILNLFKSNLNVNNATLIISTHYSEILDDIERSDSIYYTTKSKGLIKLQNLSYSFNRLDKKKSNIFLSGILGTAPTYASYNAFRKYLKKQLIEDEEEANGKNTPSMVNTEEIRKYKESMKVVNNMKEK